MVIQHNIPSLNAWRNTKINNGTASKNLEKLSSGIQINRAADDAAGLAISEKMRGQIRGLNMAKMNIDHGINLVKTADGGIAEIQDTLQRIRELSVQMTNGTYTDEDRAMAQLEVKQLYDNIDLIANTTHFNGIYMLNGKNSPTSNKVLDSFQVKLTPNTSLPCSESINVFGQDVKIDYSINNNKVTVDGLVNGTQVDSNSHSIDTSYLSRIFNVVYGSSDLDVSLQRACIQPTSDGGFLILTTTYGEDGDWIDGDAKDGTIDIGTIINDGNGNILPPSSSINLSKVVALKLDQNGNKQWSTMIGSPDIGVAADSFVELPNGNFAIISHNNNHIQADARSNTVTILDSNGDYISHEHFEIHKNSDYQSQVFMDNNSIMVINYGKGFFGGENIGVATIDFNGNVSPTVYHSLPNKIDGSNVNWSLSPRNIIVCDDGYLLVGSADDKDYQSEEGGGLWVCKLDKSFNVQYSNVYGPNYGKTNSSGASTAIPTSDGGCIVIGNYTGTFETNTNTLETTGGTNDTNCFAIRYDKYGNEIWAQSYGGDGMDGAYDIVDNSDGTFTIVGFTQSNNSGDVGPTKDLQEAWMFLINKNGYLITEKSLGAVSSGEVLLSVDTDNNGFYWFFGTTSGVGGDVGNSTSTAKGGGDIWAFTEYNPFGFRVQLDLGEYIIETDADGNPSKWIEFDICDSLFSDDGTTLKELNIKAKVIEKGNDEDGIILQVGANSPDTFTIQKSDMRTKTLFKGMNISVSTREAANATIDYVDKVINHVSGERAKFGAYQNALEHIQQNVMNGSENLQSAESAIRDLDIAKEMMEFTKNNILVQAAQSMLAQANQLPQGVLSLLR